MKRVAAFVVVLLALAAASCNRPQTGSTVVLIVRHAEKASDADDSPLSDAGAQRAQALAGALTDARVSAIYTTQFKRNQDTARPLSERTGVALTQMPVNLSNPGDYGKTLARDILEKRAGQTVLVVGHANTVPLIVEGLTGKPGEAGDAQYQDLFIVIIPPSGPARVIKTRYGQPSGG